MKGGSGRGFVGILSSNPFAIKSVLSVFEALDLEFIRDNAEDILRSCPVEYVRDAVVRGSLFEKNEEAGEGVVCCADTGFLVDHEEPERVLRIFEEKGEWMLGSLPKRCEFLAIVRAKNGEFWGWCV